MWIDNLAHLQAIWRTHVTLARLLLAGFMPISPEAEWFDARCLCLISFQSQVLTFGHGERLEALFPNL